MPAEPCSATAATTRWPGRSAATCSTAATATIASTAARATTACSAAPASTRCWAAALDGGGGSDTYAFGRGDGRDVIGEGADSTIGKHNELWFRSGIAPADVSVSRNGADLVLGIAATGDQITVRAFFLGENPSNPSNPLQKVVFDGGTTWGLGQLRAMANPGLPNNAPAVSRPVADQSMPEGTYLNITLPNGNPAKVPYV